MKKIKINRSFLLAFIAPITGQADVDEIVDYYMANPPKTEEDYRKIIREQLVSEFNEEYEITKEKAKLVLSYYLTFGGIDFERAFYSYLPPFELEVDARDFYVWIWEEIYGEESYILEGSKDDYETCDIPREYLYSGVEK